MSPSRRDLIRSVAGGAIASVLPRAAGAVAAVDHPALTDADEPYRSEWTIGEFVIVGTLDGAPVCVNATLRRRPEDGWGVLQAGPVGAGQIEQDRAKMLDPQTVDGIARVLSEASAESVARHPIARLDWSDHS